MEMLRMPPRGGANKPEPSPIPQQGNTPTMEVAHVLFMDVVGFSQLRMQQQANIQVELQNLVQSTVEVQQARKENKLIVRPTGDGMALLFLRDLLSPVRCALQVATLIQNKDAEIRQRTGGASIRLRMGVHSGSVLLVEDMNAQSDVAGEGIITAQRVMDCGDAGHILLSDEVAKKILNLDPWQRYLTNLGEVRVKHGVKVHLYNLYGRLDGPYCGNPSTPKKVQSDSNAQAEEAKKYRGSFFERNPGVGRWLKIGATCGVLFGGGFALWTKVPAVPAFAKATAAKVQSFGKPSAKPSPKAKPTARPKRTAGGNAGRGSTASYTSFSDEARVVLVPDLRNNTVDGAKGMIRAEGLRVRVAGRVYSREYGDGLICKQSPAPGARRRENTSINVWVSRGEPHIDEPDPTPDPDPTPEPEPSPGGGGEVNQSSGSNEEAGQTSEQSATL